MNIRPEVLRFAKQMEKVLKENDHKQHWSNCSVGYLLGRAGDELGELRRAIKSKDPQKIKKEATDLANFAMMIADVGGKYEPRQHKKGGGSIK